jgi:hypothetical protein
MTAAVVGLGYAFTQLVSDTAAGGDGTLLELRMDIATLITLAVASWIDHRSRRTTAGNPIN